ncbi:putative Plasma-membrane choline transporter [Blattamonas nauphoetae]|uniref:Rhodopsin n=1 Tax=Blattamonas nauphoetae TaxID=2049346 RepID=A0ABQ9XDK9_9EUKA|nr:putative Plasma-membrane choline transporter [Blattamonas nauphoetae]
MAATFIQFKKYSDRIEEYEPEAEKQEETYIFTRDRGCYDYQCLIVLACFGLYFLVALIVSACIVNWDWMNFMQEEEARQKQLAALGQPSHYTRFSLLPPIYSHFANHTLIAEKILASQHSNFTSIPNPYYEEEEEDPINDPNYTATYVSMMFVDFLKSSWAYPVAAVIVLVLSYAMVLFIGKNAKCCVWGIYVCELITVFLLAIIVIIVGIVVGVTANTIVNEPSYYTVPTIDEHTGAQTNLVFSLLPDSVDVKNKPKFDPEVMAILAPVKSVSNQRSSGTSDSMGGIFILIICGIGAIIACIGFCRICCIYCMRDRIRLVIAIMQETGKAFMQLPCLILIPLIGTGMEMVFACLFLLLLLFNILSAVSIGSVNFFHIFTYLFCLCLFVWLENFIDGFVQVGTSATFSDWYFTADKTQLKTFHVLSNIKYTFKKSGSIAVGSGILTLVQIARGIVNACETSNQMICLCCILYLILKCVLACLEHIIMFINKQAFVMIGIRGKNFITSAAEGVILYFRNFLRIFWFDDAVPKVLNCGCCVSSFVSIIILFFIIAGGVIPNYQPYNTGWPFTFIVCLFVVGLIANIPFRIFYTGSYAVLHSFLVDEEVVRMHDVKGYASENLSKHMWAVYKNGKTTLSEKFRNDIEFMEAKRKPIFGREDDDEEEETADGKGKKKKKNAQGTEMQSQPAAEPTAVPAGPPQQGPYPPPQGYPQGYPPQGYPTQGYPPNGPPGAYPPQGYPPQGYPPPGAYPPQGYPPQGVPPQGYPPVDPNAPAGQYPPQGYPYPGYPPQGYYPPPQGYPPQGYPPQGYPPQGSNPQGDPRMPNQAPQDLPSEARENHDAPPQAEQAQAVAADAGVEPVLAKDAPVDNQDTK